MRWNVSVFLALALPALAADAPVAPFESRIAVAPNGRIDEIVFGQLRKLDIEPARLCSDEVFVRRVFLDTIGMLPTATEAKDFLADSAPDKRGSLIDRLLARDEFADYWAMRWADVLRMKAEFPIKLWPKSVQTYHRWLATCLSENRPYDRMARDMLLATGSSFYVPEANFYRAMQARQPQNIAQAVALTFMGVRTEKWPERNRADLATFFSQIAYKGTSEWKEEIVYLDLTKQAPNRAVLPDGTPVDLPPGSDARVAFVHWLVSGKNPWFAQNMANRAWFWLLGRGIVHEPDDFRPDNPPSNPELLAHLKNELVKSGWDLKYLYRAILNSTTYQLSSIPRSFDARAATNFASYPLRRLDAETLIDALCQITGTTERYVSPVPEPFTYVPEEMRTVTLSDGNSTSSFLELFGKPSRDTGLASERNNASNAGQRLHLLNSTHIHKKITQGPALLKLAQQIKQPVEIAKAVYLTVLSRYPTAEELKAVSAYPEASGLKGRDVLTDLAWALINSEEFLLRH